VSMHLTVTVVHPAGGAADIDIDMADLIRACWRLGIGTSECCQEAAPGTAEIGFLTLGDMERFYDLIAGPCGDGLFYAWRWDLWADAGLRGELHFPASQIEWLTERLAAQQVVEHA
jgi:hypothetical protein